MLEAIDLNLKIFYVFDCVYPHPSKALWEFIQIVFYEIYNDGKRLSTQNRVLQGEIKQILNFI